MSGYVYVMINQSLNGLVKIGMTTREPDDRAKELSGTTGVPTPFQVIFYEPFERPDLAEKRVHAYLDELGFRDKKNREFFSSTTVEAINAILLIKNEINEDNIEADFDLSLNESDTNDIEALYQEILQTGLSAIRGEEYGFVDIEEAIDCVVRLKDLGATLCYYSLQHEIMNYSFEHPYINAANLGTYVKFYVKGIKDGVNKFRFYLFHLLRNVNGEEAAFNKVHLLLDFIEHALQHDGLDGIYDAIIGIQSYYNAHIALGKVSFPRKIKFLLAEKKYLLKENVNDTMTNLLINTYDALRTPNAYTVVDQIVRSSDTYDSKGNIEDLDLCVYYLIYTDIMLTEENIIINDALITATKRSLMQKFSELIEDRQIEL